nr:hypothetical protein SHINE37_43652 [Rhizobiaceae bacterium]
MPSVRRPADVLRERSRDAVIGIVQSGRRGCRRNGAEFYQVRRRCKSPARICDHKRVRICRLPPVNASCKRRWLQVPCPIGGTGRRARLKIEFRKECWFDSGMGHHNFSGNAGFSGVAANVADLPHRSRIAAT